MQLVAAGENFLLLFGAERVFHDRIVLVRAKNQTERGSVSFGPPLTVKVIHIELNLTKVAVRKLADLQIDQDVTLQDGVIEHEIDVKVIALERDPFLPRDEGKPFAQLQQKELKIRDQRLFQV